MSSVGNFLSLLFIGRRPKKSRLATQQVTTRRACNTGPAATNQERQKVQLLHQRGGQASIPYWRLRKWRRTRNNLYLGYFKTRLGCCHGVIKWNSQFDHNIYIHNVPQVILNGPHSACFKQIKPNKYRVHFAQRPTDLNSAIFYMETLLQRAFQNG